MSKQGTAATELKRKSGAVPARHRYPWTEEETALLRELHGTMSAAEIAQRLERSTLTVQQRAVQIGLADRTSPCRRCGQPMAYAKLGRPRLYCPEGTSCHAERTFTRYRELNPLEPRREATCEHCGKPFLTSQKSQRFCTHACGKRWWHETQNKLSRGTSINEPGIRERIVELHASGMSLRAIGRELHMNYQIVGRSLHCKPRLSPWDEKKDQFVIDQYAQQSARQIADTLGMTTPQVTGRIRVLREHGRLPWSKQ